MNVSSLYERCRLADLGLKVVNEFSDVLDEKRPGVDQKHSIHHHNNETISVTE